MPEWFFQLLGMAGTAVGIYVGIKADLAALHVKADMAAKSADQAHQRIDSILNAQR